MNVAKALIITHINCPLRSGQLKINHLPGFSPKLLVFRLDSLIYSHNSLPGFYRYTITLILTK